MHRLLYHNYHLQWYMQFIAWIHESNSNTMICMMYGCGCMICMHAHDWWKKIWFSKATTDNNILLPPPTTTKKHNRQQKARQFRSWIDRLVRGSWSRGVSELVICFVSLFLWCKNSPMRDKRDTRGKWSRENEEGIFFHFIGFLHIFSFPIFSNQKI